MTTLNLNCTDIKSIEDLHEILKKELELPDYYGRNPDALWDCLTGWVILPLTVCWSNYAGCRDKIGHDAEQILQVFKEAQNSLEGFTLIVTE